MRSLLVSGVCRSLLAGALLSAGAGCASDDDTGDVTEVIEGVNGELVYALEVSPGHSIQFFEFENGERAGVLEFSNMGDKALLDSVGKEDQSLAAVFGKLRPQQQVPSRILATDQRVLQKRSLRQAIVPDPTWATAEATAPRTVLGQAANGISSAAATCSADLLNDGWGGQWFKDTQCLKMCDTMFFPECNANWGWADLTAAGSDYFAYRQFEGDFAVAGTMSAYTTGYPYPAPKYWWTVAVPPRKVLSSSFSGSGVSWQTNHFKGDSPCGHLGTTKRVCD